MSDYNVSLEELRQHEDVKTLLEQLERHSKSRFSVSRELLDAGIPPEMVQQLIGDGGLYTQQEQPGYQPRFERPPPTYTTAYTSLYQFRLHQPLTQFLVLLLILNLMVAFVALYADLNERSLLTSLQTDPTSVTITELQNSDDLQAVVGGIAVLIYLFTVIIFLRWFWVSYKNAEAFNAYDIRFGPHWTWLGFVIPILNIWRPWQVAKEIWKASNPFVDVSKDEGWRHYDAASIIHIWWIVFFLLNRGSRTYIRQSFEDNPTIDNLISQNTWGIVFDFGNMLVAILAAAFVYQLAARQWQKYRRLDAEQSPMSF